MVENWLLRSELEVLSTRCSHTKGFVYFYAIEENRALSVCCLLTFQQLEVLELDTNSYRIGQSKIFFRAGVLAHLEEERDLKLTEIITIFQAFCRGNIARKHYNKRVQQLSAIRVIQRNCLSYLKLRNWQWWRLFTKVKPLLNVTRTDEALREALDLKKANEEKLEKTEQAFVEMEKTYRQTSEEKAILQEQLDRERDAFQEADDMRQRLQTRKQELEELLNDQMERFDEEEEKVIGLTEEKKKLLKDIQDLEDRYVQRCGSDFVRRNLILVTTGA